MGACMPAEPIGPGSETPAGATAVEVPPGATAIGRSSGIRISLLLALLPLAQAALDRRWLFDGPGRDPWIYYSYFRFAPVYLRQEPDLYYGSRLSVILPGYLVHRLLSGVPANALLHLALYGCALAAFFYVARAHAGRRGALLAGLALGGQPYFLRAIGSNYVDGFGITFYLVALAAVTAAAASPRSGRRRALLAAAGAVAAALVTANLFYAVYLPLLAAYFLALDGQSGRRRTSQAGTWREVLRREMPAAAAWAGTGAALAFIGFGGVGRLWAQHGHPHFYLNPTLHFLWEFGQTPSIFKHPLADWGAHAGWLVFPLLVLGGSLAVLARRQWRARAGAAGAGAARTGAAAGGVGAAVVGGGAVARFSQVQYLVFFAAMAALELESHGVTLEYPYYASLLLPAAALALAGQLAPLVDAMTPRVFAWFAAALGVVLALASVAGALPPAGGSPPTIAWPLALGAVMVAVVAAGRRGLGPALLLAFSLVASLLAARAAARPAVAEAAAYRDSYRFFRQVDGALSLLERADPSLRVRLWYDGSEEAGRFYDSLATAWRLCRRLVTATFPNVAGGEMCDRARLGPGMMVAVLSQRPPQATAAAAERSLASIGLRAHWLGVTPLPGPVAPLAVSWLEIAAAGPADSAVPEGRNPSGPGTVPAP
jgi:hypothetical protein